MVQKYVMDLERKTDGLKSKYQKLCEENQMLRLSSDIGVKPRIIDDTEDEEEDDGIQEN